MWAIAPDQPVSGGAPSCFSPLTRRIPAASSGLSKPESAASYASRPGCRKALINRPGCQAEGLQVKSQDGGVRQSKRAAATRLSSQDGEGPSGRFA